MLSFSFYSPKVITILISNRKCWYFVWFHIYNFLVLWISNFHKHQEFPTHYIFKYCFCFILFKSSSLTPVTHILDLFIVSFTFHLFPLFVSFIFSVELSFSSLTLSSNLSNLLLSLSINSSFRLLFSIFWENSLSCYLYFCILITAILKSLSDNLNI